MAPWPRRKPPAVMGPFEPMPRTLLHNAILALIYAVTGWAALQIAVPPGYAAPVFPPAGIALAALLTYGYRLVPGVFLGSLGVQFMAAAHTGLAHFSWDAALLTALGPTLQATAGTWLTHRLVKPPFTFEAVRSILLLLLAVAPLSSLIAPSLSVPWLASAGLIPAEDAAFSWWNWWIGDTLGVVTMTPLLLTFIGQPRKVWAPRLRTVALPLGAALVLVGVVFAQLRDWEQMRLEAQFSRDAVSLGSLLKRRFDVQMDMILAVERFVSSSEDVTASEWREFVRPWLTRYPGTLNFAWAPLVRDGERATFEAEVRRTGLPDFQIMDRAPDGGTFPAAKAEEYLPLRYVEPLAGNERAVGLNPLSRPASRSALAQTRQNGLPTATGGVRLVQAEGKKTGVILHQAVFGRDATRGRGALRGAVSTIFVLDDAVAMSFAGLGRSGLDDAASEPRPTLCLWRAPLADPVATLRRLPDGQPKLSRMVHPGGGPDLHGAVGRLPAGGLHSGPPDHRTGGRAHGRAGRGQCPPARAA